MAIPGVAVRGQRSLLRQIREALAGGGPAQQRLDMVVRIIARSMVAEVCSLYLRRVGCSYRFDRDRRPVSMVVSLSFGRRHPVRAGIVWSKSPIESSAGTSTTRWAAMASSLKPSSCW